MKMDYSAAHPGFTGFLGMIRFDNPWVLAAMAALIVGNIVLNIAMAKSVMDERTIKWISRVCLAVTILLFVASFFIMAENGFPQGFNLIPILVP